MKLSKKQSFVSGLILLLYIFLGLSAFPTAAQTQAELMISGKLVNGFRVLTVPRGDKNLSFRVYRGDYVRFLADSGMSDKFLEIPALGVRQQIFSDQDESGNKTSASQSGKWSFVKMKQTGRYFFSLGDAGGVIEVLNYQGIHYRELSASQAFQIMNKMQPLILDVRTPSEFKRGHIANAVLIPLQQLQKRSNEIKKYKNRQILIYCASGNRSTVAAKILVDQGFKEILNLRKGINDWARLRYPIEK